MSKIIIGIHGLGNKPPKRLLKMWWKKSIKEGLNRIDHPRLFLNYELVYWSHILHAEPLDPNEQNKKAPHYLREPYIEGKHEMRIKPSKVRQKVLDVLGSQMDKVFLNDDMTINFEAVTDLIIHRYFRDLEIYYSKVCLDESHADLLPRDLIRQQLADTLRKHRRKKIMLIAHSMGSIIAYDVLTEITPEVKIDTLVTIGSPLGIPVIISKIVCERRGKYQTDVTIKTPESIQRRWYNFSDLHDKVALDYTLANDFEKNSRGIGATDVVVFNDYEIRGHKNPHKAYGYLRTPELAMAIHEFLKGDKFITVRKLGEAVSKQVSKAFKPKTIRKITHVTNDVDYTIHNH